MFATFTVATVSEASAHWGWCWDGGGMFYWLQKYSYLRFQLYYQRASSLPQVACRSPQNVIRSLHLFTGDKTVPLVAQVSVLPCDFCFTFVQIWPTPFSVHYVEGTRCSHDLTSLILRHSTSPVFDHLQYAKTQGRRPRESYHVIQLYPKKMSRCICEGVFTLIVNTTSLGGDVKPSVLGCWLVLALSCLVVKVLDCRPWGPRFWPHWQQGFFSLQGTLSPDPKKV